MARTESAMIELGTTAPAFALEESITTKQISIDEVRGEHGLLVMFICRHCPFVKHVEKELAAIGRDLPARESASSPSAATSGLLLGGFSAEPETAGGGVGLHLPLSL